MSDQSKSGSYVDYKDVRIAVNTIAFELWNKKEFGKLDEHLKQLEIKNQKLAAL